VERVRAALSSLGSARRSAEHHDYRVARQRDASINKA
jgi:hypothetical protein